ncbi:hypothetical protein HBI32_250180 [Parastagonospora nodorum]|nr:hypothetical protein HBI32_250180 [Parastagonospora nodorum]
MQTNTATALANKLAAINKLVRLQTFILKILEHVEIVETNAILLPSHLSFIRIFKSITKNTNRKHRLCPKRSSAVDKVIGKYIYKTYNRVYALTAKTLSL